MFIFSDSFALLNTKVSRISVSHVAITHQRMCSNHAMDVGVGCGSCDRMRTSAWTFIPKYHWLPFLVPTFPRGIEETSWSIKSKRDFFNREIYG
mgnify:CR=1 FL=1